MFGVLDLLVMVVSQHDAIIWYRFALLAGSGILTLAAGP